ncbi:TetR/AcrR family transcriptional regulator [Haloactinomyces albus]|uniref:AcrR family transcriptional regulator n=1 Tax=Haloactinomyces albus TaxID=1352928 RepID=A0AAE3ZFE4_9ACTN|nr:TetR/AcrR family transcriptional regulator [Haloactinomyces albus]MDR7302880.1 AcrR family transcriptional regulator [Haloactinomyces albus]
MSHISRPVKAANGQPRNEPPRGDKRRERWRGHRQARRAEFVEATVRAIGQYGAEVGMDDIAAEAGVSKPVLYRHFSDKSDLYLAVGEWGTELLMQRIGPTLDEGGSIHQRIRRIISTYLGVIEEYPELYRFVVRRTFADRPVQDDPVTTEKTVIANSLSRLLGEYLRSLNLDSGGVEAWSHGLVGMVQASGDWWLDRQSMSREDLTDYLTRIIWFAIDGVLRSGGIVLDPDEPLELSPDLRVITGEDTEGSEDAEGRAHQG